MSDQPMPRPRREIPMGTCERCGQQARAWNLADVDGTTTCLECRCALTAVATRRKKRLVAIAAIVGLVILVGASAGAVNLVLYQGSPEHSLSAFLSALRDDPDGLEASVRQLAARDFVDALKPGSDTTVDDPNQGGTLGHYAAVTPIRQRMSAAVWAYRAAHGGFATGIANTEPDRTPTFSEALAGTMQAYSQANELYVPCQLTVVTVANCAKYGRTVSRQGNTACCEAVYDAPTKGVERRYHVRFTMTRVADPDGGYWRITSIDNIPEIVQLYLGGQ